MFKRKNVYVNETKKKANVWVVGIVMLINGITWTSNVYMFQELQADYNHAIVIYNSAVSHRIDRERTHRDVQEDNADIQVNPIGEVTASPTDWDGTVEVSAYNAEVGQTDSTPTITANGDTVYEGGIASNCYDFGTQIELEGLGVFTVNDRMASRYECGNADIFLFDHNEAINFGRQELQYRVVG